MARLDDRNASKLLDILEKVMIYGAEIIRIRELVVMYHQERLTKGILRDIHNRWVQLSEDWDYDVPPELLIGRDDDAGVLALGYGREWDNTKKDWGEPFFKPAPAFLDRQEEEAA